MNDVPAAERTLPALLERRAAALGDRPYLRVGGTSRTFAEMRDAVARTAGKLRRGRRQARRPRRDHVPRTAASSSTPGSRCAWLGASLVPLNTATRGPQLEHVLGNSGPRVLALETGFFQHLEVVESLPSELERIWLLDGGGDGPWRGLPVEPFPEPGDALPPETVHRGRDRLDPLHLRHDRPVEGRHVPAGAVLLVGALRRRRCSAG